MLAGDTMQGYRPDRVVRGLTTIVSIVYYGLWVGIVMALILPPALKLFAGDDPDWQLGLGLVEVELTTALRDSAAAVVTGWGPARLDFEEMRAGLHLPVSTMPWWFVGLLWLYTAAGGALMLLFAHHLRRIFRRVRDGVPFDAHNALRLRWLGMLLIALAALTGIAELCTSLLLMSWQTSDAIRVPAGLHVDLSLVFAGLVLIALAEIFRRGAELEHEQSLVV